MKETTKINITTLGCKLNFAESATFARMFRDEGMVIVQSAAQADIAIINTCSVTEHADKKCRNIIRKIHRDNPSAIIAVSGCYAQLKPEEIASIEGVDLVIGNNKEDLHARITELGGKGKAQIHSCSTDSLTGFFAAFSTSADRTRAFLKVQDGCDYCCSYCTIHNARGASRNMPLADIVREANRIAAAGGREIVITGVNTGDFGHSTGETFAQLLAALDRVEGVERYRISSIEPNLLTDEIIEFCAASKKFQPHFHIPLQSGSDQILRAMGRRYTQQIYASRVEKIRSLMPDAFIGIDVIVGFPGESDVQFDETFDFLRALAPAFLHIFPYSQREGTPAAVMPNQIRESDKSDRAKRLDVLCRHLHRQFYLQHANGEADVLFESNSKNGLMYGFTGNYLRVSAPYDRSRVNRISRVNLTGVGDDCIATGEILT